MATVDLTPTEDMTTVTIRISYGPTVEGAAAISMFAQLCAFEGLEQGFKAGIKGGRNRSGVSNSRVA